ncbi:hypothetical protein MVEG_02258 [Podila verticillata NRRL 6337]|nr:hypothetical protein MVEG_02258 [Podila verticillata NRRL 6337]
MPPAWNRHRLPMNTLNPLSVPDPLFMTDELVDTIHPPIDDAHQGAVEGTLDLSDIISLEGPPGTIHPAQQLHSHGEMNSTPVTQAQLTSASCTTASSTLSTIFSRLSYVIQFAPSSPWSNVPPTFALWTPNYTTMPSHDYDHDASIEETDG